MATKDTAAPASPAAFSPISTTISDPGPGAAREIANMSRNSLRGQPVVLIDGGALHIGNDAGAAAERQHRQHGKQAGELQQDQAHRGRVNQAASRLTGIITSRTCTSEKPSTPIDSVTVGGDDDGDQAADVAPGEADAGAEVQADRDRAHAAQRGADPGAPGVALAVQIQRAEQPGRWRRGRAVRPQKQAIAPGGAAHLGADEHREVDVGRARDKLRQGVSGQELLVVQPAAFRCTTSRRVQAARPPPKLIMPMLTKLMNSDASGRSGRRSAESPSRHSSLSGVEWTEAKRSRRRRHGISGVGPKRAEGVAAVPGHDDVRRRHGRRDGSADRGAGEGSGGQLHRLRRRL